MALATRSRRAWLGRCTGGFIEAVNRQDLGQYGGAVCGRGSLPGNCVGFTRGFMDLCVPKMSSMALTSRVVSRPSCG